jgi:hypothetical protein
MGQEPSRMASFQTFFRTVVMLITLGLLAKAWYLYGPSVDELKTIGARVSEVTSQAWREYWDKPVEKSALAVDPRVPIVGGPPAPFVPQESAIEPIPHVPDHAARPAVGQAVQLAGGLPAQIVPVAPSTPWPSSAPPQPTRLPPDERATASQDPRLAARLQQLTQLGMRDQELTSWGSRGELMRFSCNMPWVNSPAYSWHFEAIATTSLAAVEQVAAEIEAWQRGQR